MTSVPARREFDIDFFRGFVCLSLMVLHFYNTYLYKSYMELFGDTGNYLIWNWRLGVESFFVLAGFMMAHMLRPAPGETVSLLGYLKRRFFRLILPYWTAIAIFACYRWGARLFLNAEAAPTIRDILAQMFLVQEFFVDADKLEKVIPIGYWSMVSLEQFYLLWLALYAVVMLIVGRNEGKGYGHAERVMCFVTFVMCIGSLCLWIWPNVETSLVAWHMVKFDQFFRFGDVRFPMQLPLYAIFLSMGMLLYWAIRQKMVRGYFWVALGLLAVASVWTNYSRLWRALLVAVAFLPLARGFRLPNYAVMRFLTFCGRRSYSMYLVHGIAGVAFLALTWKITSKSPWLAIPLTLLALVVSILASLVFYRYVELPCQNKSRTVPYRRKRVEAPAPVEAVPETCAVPVI